MLDTLNQSRNDLESVRACNVDGLIVVILLSLVFVAASAIVGGAVAKLLFDFVTAPLRDDDE